MIALAFILLTVVTVSALEVITGQEMKTNPTESILEKGTRGKCNLLERGKIHSLVPEEFYLSACTLCYRFLPPDPNRPPDHSKTLRRWEPQWTEGGYRLKTLNKNNQTVRVPGDPDGKWGPEKDVSLRERAKWRQCCQASKQWCSEVTAAPYDPATADQSQEISSGKCPSMWDGWSSWKETPPGVSYGSCPAYILYSTNTCASSKRTCYLNGTWEMLTNYSTCSSYEEHRRGILELVGEYGVSIVLLVPALSIFFLLYRHVNGHRIRLHRNLFIALLFHSMTEVVYLLTVVLARMDNVSSKTKENEDSGASCILVVVATKYFRCSSFMWMFCEGYYLHRRLASAFSPDGSLVIFYVIGWGLPILPTALYSLLRVKAGHGSCWIDPSNFEWVLIVPNILSLVANMMFLASILKVLAQLKQPVQDQNHNRRTLRATLLLVPLLGLHFVLTLYRPAWEQCLWRRMHSVLDHALDGLQGAAVACLFCFFNSEVHELLRQTRRTLLDRYQPGFQRPSRGSHSFSTVQSTLVTQTSVQGSRNA